MKLKTIASIFNRHKRLIVYTAPSGKQWISNGFAAYSLSGIPTVTPQSVLRIFDVPIYKYKKWLCEESSLPNGIDFDDFSSEEINIEPLKTGIKSSGDSFLLFADEEKIYSFAEIFIKPLLDESDYLTYYKRQMANDRVMLACKIGLELKALIAPFMLHTEDGFTEEISRIAALYAAIAHKTNLDS